MLKPTIYIPSRITKLLPPLREAMFQGASSTVPLRLEASTAWNPGLWRCGANRQVEHGAR